MTREIFHSLLLSTGFRFSEKGHKKAQQKKATLSPVEDAGPPSLPGLRYGFPAAEAQAARSHQNPGQPTRRRSRHCPPAARRPPLLRGTSGRPSPPALPRPCPRSPPGMKQPFSGGAQGNIISPVPWTEAPAAPADGRPTSAKRFPWVPGTDISKPEDVAFLRQESPMFRKHLRRIQSPSLPFSPTAPGERTLPPLFSTRQSGVLAKIPTQAARQRAFSAMGIFPLA